MTLNVDTPIREVTTGSWHGVYSCQSCGLTTEYYTARFDPCPSCGDSGPSVKRVRRRLSVKISTPVARPWWAFWRKRWSTEHKVVTEWKGDPPALPAAARERLLTTGEYR